METGGWRDTLAAGAAALILAGNASAQPPPLDLVSYRAPEVGRLTVDGSVVVAFTVRANGRIDDVVTLAATERRLAAAAEEAVEQWRFARDPDVGRGPDATPSAVLRREVVEFVFKRDGVVNSMSHAEAAKSWFPEARELAVRTFLSDDLDAPLVRLPTPASEEAAALVSALRFGGRATLSFVVDESGRVRIPMVVAADDPALADAALAMVRGWRYEPPTRNGAPIVVEERSSFTFPPPAEN